MAGLMFGSEKGNVNHALNQYMLSVGQAMELNPVPQAILPLYEDAINESTFTGRPILTPAQAELAPQEQWGARTSLTARTVGRAAHVLEGAEKIPIVGGAFGLVQSPARVEHLVRGYLGTSSSYLLGAIDMMIDPMVKGTAPSQNSVSGLLSNAFVRPVTTDSDPTTTKYVTNLFDTLSEIRKLSNTYQNYVDTGRAEEAKEYKQEYKAKLSVAGNLLSVNRRIAELNEQMKKLRNDTELPDSERERRIIELNKVKNDLAKRFFQTNREAINQ